MSTPNGSGNAGITLSWPVFLVLVVCVAGIVFWSTRQAVDAQEIGAAAGAAAAETVKNQTDEIIEQAISKAADEMVERSGEMVDKVVHETIGEVKERAEDRVRNISVNEIFGILEEIKDEGLRTTRDLAYEVVPISVEDEWSIGQRIGDTLRDQMTVVHNPELQRRVEALAKPIFAHLKRTAGQKYQITVMESDEVNAFAILGGQIFLASGLIDRMRTDAAIQSVIAHEIAHVELEHCVRGAWFGIKAQDTIGANVISGVLTNINQLAERGFTEKQELESDAFAYQIQYHFGIPKQDRTRFVAVLWEMESEQGTPPSSKQEIPLLAALNRHYRTHPEASERYTKLMNMQDDPSP